MNRLPMALQLYSARATVRILLLAITALVPALATAAPPSTNAISQYGITWTFAQPRPVGQFANGDWWVIGPVTLVDIAPKTIPGHYGPDKDSDGSMLNPVPGQPQGLYRAENPAKRTRTDPPYDAALNVSLQLPYTIPPGNSLYSTWDNPNTWTKGKDQEKTYFRETAVLTVLATEPPPGSFRPPYAGHDKTIKPNWNVASLDYRVLRTLEIPNPANAPDVDWLVAAMQRPLLEMHLNWPNTNWKATWDESKPGGYPRRAYGREVAGISGGAGLMLNTSLSHAEKEPLLIHMVQWGIDIHGLLQAGMQWQANGGHQHGRLLPLFIAARVLHDPDLLEKAGSKGPFQEMINHYFISQADIDRPRKPRQPPSKPYTPEMLGMPEWMSGGPQEQAGNSAAWTDGEEGYGASGYRYVNGSPNCGVVLTLLLMGGREVVNQEAFFRYHIERYYPREKPSRDAPFNANANGIQPFVRDLWDAYLSP